MMAHELVAPFVIGERNGARGAFGHIAAIAAEDKVRETALVQQQNRLAPRVKRARQRLGQRTRKHGARAFREFLRHVYDVHLGKGLAVRPFGQGDAMPQGVGLAAAKRFDRRRGAAQHERGAMALRHPRRDVARVVARRAFLLVGVLVLFVDDDQAQPLHRAEQRAARAHHDALFALADRLPLIEALRSRHARMHDGDRMPEAPLEARDRLRGERYLRHEDKGSAPLLQTCANGAKIYLGLARSGHAVNEGHLSAAAVEAFRHKREGLRLPLRELERLQGARPAR